LEFLLFRKVKHSSASVFVYRPYFFLIVFLHVSSVPRATVRTL